MLEEFPEDCWVRKENLMVKPLDPTVEPCITPGLSVASCLDESIADVNKSIETINRRNNAITEATKP